MLRNALAVSESTNALKPSKSKPRYTEAENSMLFESWWDPQKRQELVGRLGRKMSALRSQFCRLLKEKGLTNQDYYNLMQSKFVEESGTAPRKRNRELKDIDRSILEIFCKHQALGNSRTEACDELQNMFGNTFSAAALKLRFYRLIKRFRYSDQDLIRIGRGLSESSQTVTKPIENIAKEIPTQPTVQPKHQTVSESHAGIDSRDNSFFYQLSTLPETLHTMEERMSTLEAQQRRQLDLRGFIEHLLAVERDLKREDKLLDEIQKLMDENQSISEQAEMEHERLKKREAELADVYKMLDNILSDFMHLESVSKLASLGDFMHRLEITVDQFGNVLKSRRMT